jgi:phosphopantetheine--protein transferase-like protein
MQVGIDIQQTSAVERLIGTSKMERIFSTRELEYIKKKNYPPQTITGLFCAKEAFFKATGKGIIMTQLPNVEVWHDPAGAPYYQLSPELRASHKLENATITLSISHTGDIAVAVCIILLPNLFT